MFRRWLASHRSLAITVTSGSLIAALVTVIAVVSTGYTAQRVELGDGAVWVANSQQQAIGRANPEVLEFNSVVPTTGNLVDVLQRGQSVLSFDRSESKIDVIDPATSKVSESVALPPDRPEVFIAGTNVVVFEQGTGQVWITPIASFPSFDSQSQPSLTLGRGAVVSVDPAGMLFAFSSSTGQVLRVDAARSDSAQATQALSLDSDPAALSITSVGGRWAVLDSDAKVLRLPDRTVDLAPALGTGTTPVLQWAAADGDHILISHSGGLVSVPLGGGEPTAVVTGRAGSSARPMMLDGCEYSAWSDGGSWRRCTGEGAGVVTPLAAMNGNARLTFTANGAHAVLNDARSGATWAIQRNGQLIDNWDALIKAKDDQPQEQQNDDTLPPEVSTVQQPPVAVDDAFGARPGRSTVLPVLLNDYDPNGDVLVVASVTPIDESIGRLDLIQDRQQVQLTLQPGAVAPITFSYTITDGRGGTATALVTVTVKQPTENSPPMQVRTTKAQVESGLRVTIPVLGDWVDPDGDAFYLTTASVAEPDAVTYKPQGTVVYSDAGAGGDLKNVFVVVSDGAADASGSIAITVKAPGDLPITAEPFVVSATAGEEVTVAPLLHVRGGNAPVRLNSVPAKTDAVIVPSYEAGTFRFTSDQVRTHYLEYVVTDGSQTVTGLVRIDVESPPDANTKPVTTPKTVFVKTLQSERVDVAGTDIDPAGGVLLVTGVSNVPPGSGVRAEVLEQRVVRVSLDRPLDSGPITFTYRVSNGLADAEGVITVVEIPAAARIQPPVATDDTVTVRVGEAIDIPVLANDEHPDGLDLTLQPKLQQELPADSGLLFASGRNLRYLAPARTGNFTAAYQVTGPDGQSATALVKIAVREADAGTNNPPVPLPVTARVLAGETVRISIPLGNIDPDGDSVQLIGQATNPLKGAVTAVESDTISYQAGDYSAGTDSFTYTVIDSLGARATGTVRIGISPRLDGARNPVANVDNVTVRPGFTVSVQALANDSDPDGSPLSIVKAEPNDAVTTATVVGTTVVAVTPPQVPGDYGVIYTIQNARGGTSQSFIRVTVDPDAKLAYPQASDTVLTLSDVLDRTKISVDVLANVFFADGDARSLNLSVYPGYSGSARVGPDKSIEVTVGDRGQIIPFKVTHPSDPTVFSYAFIRVPGFDDALPQLDRRAPSLRVKSEDQLTIDLNNYVIAVGGKQVRITDPSTVQATHANGANLVSDSNTLVYTSADKYFGPASISFEVTDGTSATDPNGRTAILVLPITVLPRDNQPPVFSGAVLDFEPGQEKQLDLLKLTTYPYPADVGELVYSLIGPQPDTFTTALNGTVLTIRAKNDTAKGSTASVSVGVRDSVSEGGAGRIELRVVQSTRPLPVPAPDTAVTRRGQTTTVRVLANDESTNPFPDVPLRVVDIRGLGGNNLPAGVDIKPSADKSTLTVTVAPATSPVDVTLQYQVADASGDPERYVWGTVTISVQDRPDPVANIAPTGFADRTITLRWNAGAANNSPITSYRVTSTKAGTVVGTTDCSGTTCSIPTAGNGPTNAVTITVVASNAIGQSDPVTLADSVWSDIIPPAPTVLSSTSVDRGLKISWNAVTTPAGGSPVDRYRVTVGSFTADVNPSACSAGVCTLDTTAQGWSFDNGVPVTYTVSPRNSALTALSVFNSSEPRSDVPAGPPVAVGAPLATTVSDSVIRAEWTGAFGANGKAISQFTAVIFTGSTPTCSANGNVNPKGGDARSAGTAQSIQFDGLAPNAGYSVIVFAFNGQGCTASPIVSALTLPAVIDSLSFSDPVQNGQVFDFVYRGGSIGGQPLGSGYVVYYRLNGGTEYGPIALDQPLAADQTQFGTAVSVTARACRADAQTVCQTSSSAPQFMGTPVDPRLPPGLTFVEDRIDPAPDLDPSGTFTWLGLPPGTYENVEASCGPSPAVFVPATDLTCHADAAALQIPTLTIRVTANGGKFYTVTYNSTDL